MSDNAARIYGNMDWTDQGGSPYLVPGEKPRMLDPYVEPGSPCPHCGKNRVTWHLDRSSRRMVAECGYCGYYKEKYLGDAMPLTEEMLAQDMNGGRPLVTVACQKCGREFQSPEYAPQSECKRCRQIQYDREWRKRNPEAHRAIQLKKNLKRRVERQAGKAI